MISPKTIEQALGEMKSLRDCLRWSVSSFQRAGLHYGHGTDNAWDEARWLVLGALALPFDSPEWVLVPRSPIAEMIESGFEPWLGGLEPSRILDLCCGSGCIGIAAGLHFDGAAVDLADISPAALAVARRNVSLHAVEESVRVIESDLFAGLGGERYELILCNPPYVDAAEMTALPAEFRHEPRLGLAAGADGLDLVRRILQEARAHLSDDGMLVLEVGASAAALEAAYPRLPMVWPDFERGGQGVALIRAADLPA